MGGIGHDVLGFLLRRGFRRGICCLRLSLRSFLGILKVGIILVRGRRTKGDCRLLIVFLVVALPLTHALGSSILQALYHPNPMTLVLTVESTEHY